VPDVADPDLRREVRLLYGVTRPQAVIYAVSAVVLTLPGVTSEAAARASVLLLVPSAIAQVLALFVAHSGRIVTASHLVIATTLGTAMLSVTLIGGLRGTLPATLLLAVLVAGIVRGWRAAGVAAALSIAYAVGEHFLEAAGLAPVVLDRMFPGSSVVSTVAMLAIVAALLALYAREIELAAEDVRHSNARVLASERALAEVVRTAPDGIIVMNAAGVVESVNEAVLRMTGRDESEIVGKNLSELPGVPDAAAEETLHDGFARTLSGDHVMTQLPVVRADGSELVIETNARLAARPDGTTAIQVIVRDVTARVHAERDRARLEEQLLDARRMEGIGRLAGGIAHDFRNLLTPVIVNARSIVDDRGLDPAEVHTLAGEIEIAAQRANELTGQLLAFARRQMLEPKVLDLNGVVRGLEPILRRLVREDVRLDLRLAATLPSVRADRSQLEQVVLNLVANACDAMPEGGHLLLATAGVAAAGSPGQVALLVSDTGRGMSDDVRRRIFEPFFTTKESGRGVGLGLATVHGVVSQSGGTIQVESEPGKGSTFRVLLPAVPGVAEPATAVPEVEPLFPAGMRVLVVDDAPLVRGTVARVLRARGLEVHEAEDGLAALAVARADGGRFDLLVTDVVMPGLAGPPLAEELRKLQPGLAVLFISGYADEGVVAGGQVAPEVDFLPKPFTPSQLIARVGEALHRARERARVGQKRVG
jgi:PAS domain S-box-containing protein